MKILLQHKTTGHYLKESGTWSADALQALSFLSATSAIDYCLAREISEVQIVLKFQEQHYDIVLPVIADHRRLPLSMRNNNRP